MKLFSKKNKENSNSVITKLEKSQLEKVIGGIDTLTDLDSSASRSEKITFKSKEGATNIKVDGGKLDDINGLIR